MNELKDVHFGWILPTGTRQLPAGPDGDAYIRRVLGLINGRFHSTWITDHLMDGQSPIPEAFVTLSYYAGLFPELFWGTVVFCHSYRNPALLAKMGATFQQLSGGRFILGIGAGWKEDEYRAYGYEYPRASVRIAQMAEAIQICKAMWDSERVEATFNGRYYQINKAICQPKPMTPPPIMGGGGGEKLTLRVVAEHADWWNLPGAPPQEYARKLGILEAYCEEYGRSLAEIRKTWMGVVSIAESRQQAEKQLEHYPIWPGDVPLVGTPDDIRIQLNAYINLGVDLFLLSFADEPDMAGINLFMNRVMHQ